MSQVHGDQLGIAVFLGDVYNIKYSLVASLAFLLFDHILTWPTELKHIWKAQWSFAKFLYIATHYWGVSILIINTTVFFKSSMSLTFCRHFYYTEIPFTTTMILLVEVILITRLYAVYDCNRAILVFTSLLAVGTAVSSITIALLGLPAGLISLRINKCYINPIPVIFKFTLLPQLICEGCLCILMVIQVYSVHRFCGIGPLLRLLIRDSVIYFFGIFGILLVNTIIWNGARATGLLAIGWMTAVPCVLGSRLLLNTRQWAVYEKTLFSQVRTAGLRFRTSSAGCQVQHTLNHKDISIGTDVADGTCETEGEV